jgi:exonuclease III
MTPSLFRPAGTRASLLPTWFAARRGTASPLQLGTLGMAGAAAPHRMAHEGALRCLSLNVNGLGKAEKLRDLVHGFLSLSAPCYHVLCLQETHLAEAQLLNAFNRLCDRRAVAHVSLACSAVTSASQGVAIVVHPSAPVSEFALLESDAASADPGRYVLAACRWNGARVLLGSVYAPSGPTGGRDVFFSQRLFFWGKVSLLQTSS